MISQAPAMAALITAYSSSALSLSPRVPSRPIANASSAVGNGSTDAVRSSARLHHSRPPSTLAIRVKRAWWLTHTTPM